MIKQKIVIAAYKHILQLLRPVKYYPYHNIGHTLDVFKRARQLCEAEGVNDDDATDVLLGALFHDTGFTQVYNKNESVGAEIARKWLEAQAYPEIRIKKIEDIIMATVLFAKPHNLLEQIIQDADLDNLGRKDGLMKTAKYAEELEDKTEGFNMKNYLDFTAKLYANFSFNTPTAKKERSEGLHANLIALKEKYNLD